MKKRNSFRCIVLVLLAFSFIVLSFKNLVYSGTTGIPLESSPRGIAINPITDIAVVANERSNSVSIVDLKTQSVISTIPHPKEWQLMQPLTLRLSPTAVTIRYRSLI